MHIENDTYYPGSQVGMIRNAAWRWGWLIGFWAGVLFMALADVTDLHICMGECDNRGTTLFRQIDK